MPEADRRRSMHVVDRHGRVFSAGDAVIRLWAVFPRTRLWSYVVRLVPPLRRKVAAEYRRVSERRDELSSRVPDVAPTVVPPRWLGDGS